jgi:hypothetical protein
VPLFEHDLELWIKVTAVLVTIAVGNSDLAPYLASWDKE